MKGKIFCLLLLLVVFGGGLCSALYPLVNGAILNQQQEILVQAFQNREKAELSSQPVAPKDELRAAMEAYNRRIFEEGQSGFCSAEAYETPSFLLTDYGREEEVFGVISIPRLQIEMPIYLGASKENLALGAAHLSQTSLPIGGANSNCVIAGHRGWRGGAYFRDLPKLKPGDQVVITNLWEMLTYEVQQVQEVAAQKSKVLMIQSEQDLLTLMTCAYGANGVKNRYLVICSRVEESSANTN